MSKQKNILKPIDFPLHPWYTNIVAGDTAKKYRGVEQLGSSSGS